MKRAIIRDVITWEEKASLSRGSFSWSRLAIHTLTGECGHKRVHRGDGPPKKFFLCKACSNGDVERPIAPGPRGVVDKRSNKIDNALAAALVPGGRTA